MVSDRSLSAASIRFCCCGSWLTLIVFLNCIKDGGTYMLIVVQLRVLLATSSAFLISLDSNMTWNPVQGDSSALI